VALHSGYCLRRQYAEYAGIGYGQIVRDFLDQLVERRVARRFTYRPDRGHLYHLFARPLYAALQQEDNRNRRHASPALIARRLMLLDFALTQPALEWFVTEREKVEFFTARLQLPPQVLPQRTYDTPGRLEPPAIRYCVQKLPVFLAGAPPRVHFVCLVTDRFASDIRIFVREHQTLLTELQAYTLVALRPAYVSNDRACTDAWNVAHEEMQSHSSVLDPASTTWYLATRQRIEQSGVGTLSVADIDRYRTCRTRAAGRLDALYTRWLALGTPPLETVQRSLHDRRSPSDAPSLVVCALPHRYEQFGSLPGVA
jgi:hypothetical protein